MEKPVASYLRLEFVEVFYGNCKLEKPISKGVYGSERCSRFFRCNEETVQISYLRVTWVARGNHRENFTAWFGDNRSRYEKLYHVRTYVYFDST